MPLSRPLWGLVPAAGRASRLGPLARDGKEILPLGRLPDGTPRLACHDLLASFAVAEVAGTVVAVAPEKPGVRAALGDGARWGLALHYVEIAASPGVPWTLAAALARVPTEVDVALGFPDLLARPHDLVARLALFRAVGRADVALAVVATDRPASADLVTVVDGRVTALDVKPRRPPARGATWLFAVWTPRFSRFLRAWTERAGARTGDGTANEAHVGDVFSAALAAGFTIAALDCPDAAYLDVGTPETLALAAGFYGA